MRSPEIYRRAISGADYARPAQRLNTLRAAQPRPQLGSQHPMTQDRELELLRKIEALVLERERLRAGLKMIAEYAEAGDLESVRLIAKTVRGVNEQNAVKEGW